MKTSRQRFLLALGAAFAGLALVVTACGGGNGDSMEKKDGGAMEKPGDTMEKKDGTAMEALPEQLFAAHYVDSSPSHGQVFAQAPEKVLINFNFTLNEISSITVAKDGTTLSTAPVTLGPNKLSMSVPLGAAAGDGLYVVTYKACWPDRSCHDGRFAFEVDSKTRTSYIDMTGKSEVAIDMRDIMFSPANIVVSRGTKVTWTNRDDVIHFVNTDPHPSHNVLPALNSLEIRPGATHTFTFAQAGEWAYHCSAHYPAMVARILVAA